MLTVICETFQWKCHSHQMFFAYLMSLRSYVVLCVSLSQWIKWLQMRSWRRCCNVTILPSSYLMWVVFPSVLGHTNDYVLVDNATVTLFFVVNHSYMQPQCNWKLFLMFAINTADALFLSQVSSQARISSQALSEIESRHQDIICLESSIKELHEIFVDTAMLLEIQVRSLPHSDSCKGNKLNLADVDSA